MPCNVFAEENTLNGDIRLRTIQAVVSNVTYLDLLRIKYSKKDMKVADDEGMELVYLEQNSYKTEITFLAETKVKFN